MAYLEGRIVLRDHIVSGRVDFDSHIREIVPQSGVPERYILPGFIDGHEGLCAGGCSGQSGAYHHEFRRCRAGDLSGLCSRGNRWRDASV